MVRLCQEYLRNKAVNLDQMFYQRAETGLYPLLHLLRAKVDTGAVLADHN